MRCNGCNKELDDDECLMNSEEDFIENKCLCRGCLGVSNQEVNEVLNEFRTNFKPSFKPTDF